MDGTYSRHTYGTDVKTEEKKKLEGLSLDDFVILKLIHNRGCVAVPCEYKILTSFLVLHKMLGITW
jgi:hypothetical protein